MNRWLWIASIAVVMSSTTGCLRHNTRCNNGCQQCNTRGGGLLGKLAGGCNGDCNGGCRTGCVPGPIGWQQGGLNYSGHLCPHGGTAGHCATCGPGGMGGAGGMGGMGGAGGIGGGQVMQGLHNGSYSGMQGLHNGAQQQINPGPPTGAVAYPYYTHRGPRDFLLDNPPSIGR